MSPGMAGLDDFNEQMAKMGALNELVAEFEKNVVLKEEAKDERKKNAMEEGGRICSFKDCKEKGKQRCVGCNFAFFCSKECQRKGWGEHREECKEIKEEFKTVVVRKVDVLPPGHPMYDPVLNTVAQGAFRIQVSGWF